VGQEKSARGKETCDKEMMMMMMMMMMMIGKWLIL
jgi:hypothetical protein